MNRDMKLALAAGAVYAGAEVFLGEQYPLRDPVSLPVRMAVAGGLAVLATLLASQLVGAEGRGAA